MKFNNFLLFFDRQQKTDNDQLVTNQYLVSLLREAVDYYGIKDTESDPYGMRVHKAIRANG